MQIIYITLKDLKQILNDRKSLLFLMIMPVVFTVFIGFVLGMSSNDQADQRFVVGWASFEPEGTMSLQLRKQLEQSVVVRVEEVETSEIETGSQKVMDGQWATLMVVPEGFSSSVYSGNPLPVDVYTDAASAAGQAASQVIRAEWSRLQSAAAIARLTVNRLEKAQGVASEVDRQAAMDTMIEQALLELENPPLKLKVEKAQTMPGSTNILENSFNQSSPGMMVMFAIFGLTSSAMVLVLERKSRTLERMMTTATNRAQIIAGHTLAMFVVVFVQQLILAVFGQLALGVNYLHAPFAVLVVMISLSLWVACMGLFISIIAKVEEQVILLAMILMFIFSALGGVWFPLEFTGPAFSKFSHLLPGAWAMDGYQNILVRGLGLNSVILPATVLFGFALLFFSAAIVRFRAAEA